MSQELSNQQPAAPAFALSDEQRELKAASERYFMDFLHPLNQRMDDEEWWPEDAMPALGEMGYLGLTVPEEYGGQGLDMLTAGLICEVMNKANHAFGLSWAAHDNLCLNNIYRNGNDDMRRRYLPGLCDGSKIGALGLTEPGAGSDALGSMRTKAVKQGDKYILNGRKLFITNGPVADFLLVYAKTEPERGAKGISAFVVEKDFPGFEVAQKLNKMGFRGSQTGELLFDDCEVPAENLVGRENEGVAVVMSGLDLERAMIAPIGIGIAERALELSIEYAKIREQFGKPIASFQMIQSMIAEMYARLEAARSLTYSTLAACEGLAVGEGGRGEIHKLTAASVWFAAEMQNKVVDMALQIHGGSGYMWEAEINRLFRSTKLLEIGAGTQEVRKMIMSSELLK